MANILQMLAGLLGGEQQPTNALAAAGQGRVLRPGGLDTPAGGGAMVPYAAPQPVAVDNMPTASTPSPAASPAPSGGGIGGFMQNLFGRNLPGENETVGWLQSKGYDQNSARYIANNPELLQRTLVQAMQPAQPDEYNQRATAALKLGLKQGSPEFQQFVLTSKLPSDEGGGFMAVGENSTVFDKNSRQFIAPPNSRSDEVRTMTPDEVSAAGLPPGVYQRDGKGKITTVGGVRDQDATFGRYQDIRKEIQGLPSYKNYSQAAPIYKTMIDASKRDTKAADLNLVYGLGKIFDPGSVVREGEMIMVKDTASLPDWLIGSIQSLNGGARLQPETRAAILAEARSRIGSYRELFDTDMTQYRDLATQFSLDPKFLLPPVEDIQEPPPATTKPTQPTDYKTKYGLE